MPSFQYLKPTEEEIELMQEFRNDCEAIFAKLEEKVPNSRGRALAITKLEEFAFWLNKSITHKE